MAHITQLLPKAVSCKDLPESAQQVRMTQKISENLKEEKNAPHAPAGKQCSRRSSGCKAVWEAGLSRRLLVRRLEKNASESEHVIKFEQVTNST
jgi:hypothetical protein